MEFEQWAELIESGSVTLVFALLWITERTDRKSAEKRERDVLRGKTDLPPEE